MTPSDIVAAARTFINVPFLHQGRSIHGVDCIGLVIEAGRAVGLMEILKAQGRPFVEVPYSRLPDGRTLVSQLRRYLEPIAIEDATDGDVFAFWLRKPNLPRHCAIKTGVGLIHCLLYTSPSP